MTFYGKCGKCNKKRFFIKKRTYSFPKIGTATSKNELCFSCYLDIKRLNKQIQNASR